MKKFTPILILILIVGVVSVSGCIHYVDSEDNQSDDNVFINNTTPTEKINDEIIDKINKSGNIETGNQSLSNAIKNKSQENTAVSEPKISKSEIEKEIVRIMKLDDNEDIYNYTANATLTYYDNKPIYIVDVFDDFGWCAYLEVDANNGPEGNDEEGYGFLGGAARGETGDEPIPIQGIMPKLSYNEAREIMNNELKNNYSSEDINYRIEGYLNDSTPYFNISIDLYKSLYESPEEIGTAYMNANTGEIIFINITGENTSDSGSSDNQKVYSVNEAGDYIDIEYKGVTVGVRENYPYYSPQNDKIYYSQEEEAEDLYQMSLDIGN